MALIMIPPFLALLVLHSGLWWCWTPLASPPSRLKLTHRTYSHFFHLFTFLWGMRGMLELTQARAGIQTHNLVVL